MPQASFGKIIAPVKRINQRTTRVPSYGIDGEVPADEIFFQCHLTTGMDHEASVTRSALALGPCQGIFVFRLRMQENGEIPTDLLVAQREHFFRRAADNDPIPFSDGEAEQFVSHGPTDQIDFH
jgi:hypothetical protein